MKIDLEKRSKKGTVNIRDLFHGLISAVITSVVTSLYEGLSSGHVDPKEIATYAGVAGLGYIGTQLTKNSEGNPLKSEPNEAIN